MGKSDWKEVSTEDHELEYLLGKFGKRLTQENKKKLKKIIQDFKSNNDYSPHQHEDLYQYIDDISALDDLEDADE